MFWVENMYAEVSVYATLWSYLLNLHTAGTLLEDTVPPNMILKLLFSGKNKLHNVSLNVVFL